MAKYKYHTNQVLNLVQQNVKKVHTGTSELRIFLAICDIIKPKSIRSQGPEIHISLRLCILSNNQITELLNELNLYTLKT